VSVDERLESDDKRHLTSFSIPFSGAFGPTPKVDGMAVFECKNQSHISYL
jgi:hypothetical protein